MAGKPGRLSTAAEERTGEAAGAMAWARAVPFPFTSSRPKLALRPSDSKFWIQQPGRTKGRCPHAKPLDATGRSSIGWRLNAMESAAISDFAERIRRFCLKAFATAYFMPRMAVGAGGRQEDRRGN